MMKPISFVCRATLASSPEAIAVRILDVSQWPDFPGCWPIPGIAAAEFDRRTPEIVGSRIRVRNRDGSSHVEEIVEWNLPERIVLRMDGFSPPLSWLATHFLETWDFRVDAGETTVARTFELFPRSVAARPALRVIAFLLKRAVVRHLRILGQAERG